jgi:hypothetical protein
MTKSDREWLAIRKKAGRKIDPETAEVLWEYGLSMRGISGSSGEAIPESRPIQKRATPSSQWRLVRAH